MSQAESRTGEADPADVRRPVLRTVTPPYRGRPNAEMSAIGLAYAAGLVILLLPLLPLFLVVWVVVRLIDFATAQVDETGEE